MNYDQDPPRWTSAPDEAPELLRGAFQAGRNEGPSKLQMQKLALKIAVLSAGGAVALGTAKAAAGGKVAASAASWSLAKLAGVLIVAGSIATGAVIWNRSPQPASRAAAPRAPAADPATAATPLEAQALPAQLADPAPVAAGRPVVTSLSGALSDATDAPPPPAFDEPAARNDLAPAAAGSPRVRRVVATRVTHAAKATRPAQRAQPPADSPERPEPMAESAGTGPAPTEIELLRRAQLALRARPRETYQLTEEHRQRFPNGAFALERDALAIQALIRAGDAEMARDLAESFLKAHPDSPHAHRFREAMGIR